MFALPAARIPVRHPESRLLGGEMYAAGSLPAAVLASGTTPWRAVCHSLGCLVGGTEVLMRWASPHWPAVEVGASARPHLRDSNPGAATGDRVTRGSLRDIRGLRRRFRVHVHAELVALPWDIGPGAQVRAKKRCCWMLDRCWWGFRCFSVHVRWMGETVVNMMPDTSK